MDLRAEIRQAKIREMRRTVRTVRTIRPVRRPGLSPGVRERYNPALGSVVFEAQESFMDHATLAQRVKAVALLEGDFTLRSGKKSKYYFDKYLFETQPDVLEAMGAEIARRLPAGTQRIAGPELGAVALAAAAALASRVPFFIVRNAKKDYGTSKTIEGKLLPGENVVLVEDIVTTGGQVVEAIKNITAAGAKVTKVIVALDRLEGGRENILAAAPDVAYEPILTKADMGM
jgi:orotate phosphoribosyltransferase